MEAPLDRTHFCVAIEANGRRIALGRFSQQIARLVRVYVRIVTGYTIHLRRMDKRHARMLCSSSTSLMTRDASAFRVDFMLFRFSCRFVDHVTRAARTGRIGRLTLQVLLGRSAPAQIVNTVQDGAKRIVARETKSTLLHRDRQEIFSGFCVV
jgi:hypothetical protein